MNHAALKEKGADELPKSVNLFLGRCINSAYSMSPSVELQHQRPPGYNACFGATKL
jgi:hypothetical protein